MENDKKNLKMKVTDLVLITLIIILILTLSNTYRLTKLNSKIESSNFLIGIGNEGGIINTLNENEVDVIPKGIPQVYGRELGVSYDDVSANNQQKADQTIRKLGILDDQIKLSDDLLQRYIKIAGNISCEYCCGADSIIFTKDVGRYKAGDAACGCAHSYAMRGLAKYLLLRHGTELSDDQILEELGKWKTLFFPSQISLKAKILQSRGIELNYINLASNKYRGIEQSAISNGGMVGGC